MDFGGVNRSIPMSRVRGGKMILAGIGVSATSSFMLPIPPSEARSAPCQLHCTYILLFPHPPYLGCPHCVFRCLTSSAESITLLPPYNWPGLLLPPMNPHGGRNPSNVSKICVSYLSPDCRVPSQLRILSPHQQVLPEAENSSGGSLLTPRSL